MLNKFLFWISGVFIVAMLSVTSYAAIAGIITWDRYQSIWAALLGVVVGYISRLASESKSATPVVSQ